LRSSTSACQWPFAPTFPETTTVREAGIIVWDAGTLVPVAVVGVLDGTIDADGSIQLEIASGHYTFSAV
jgi:hypothetical protein